MSKRANSSKGSGRASRTPVPPIRKPWLDRLADWLAARRRPTRILIAAVLAILLAGELTILLYSFLFTLTAQQIGSNATGLLTGSLIGLLLIGMIAYWIGWRLLVGFDMEETPLRPGRPAAWWVTFGIGFSLFMLVASLIAVSQALQPY